MMRRFSLNRSLAASSMRAPATLAMPSREFHTVWNLVLSGVMMSLSIACFASWGNNICNISKYGWWRFRNQIDDPIMVEDFRYARYIGGFVGFAFYWFIVGPKKYYDSDYGMIPGNKRFGPF